MIVSWVEPIWYCLVCNARIRESEFVHRNGVCNTCPKLTKIAPEFWKVIMHLASLGDVDAQETYRRYGEVAA